MASRRIEDLHPITREKVQGFLHIANQNGIDVLIYCTYRSPEEQEVLYLQGRLEKFGITLEQLNQKRKEFGLYPLSKKEANRIVTNAKPWQSFHQYGFAFDCVPLQGGKPDWSNIEAYKTLEKIGKQVGLEWAGEWRKFKEMPHFQDTDTYNHIVQKK